jgi:hypothetical protein
LNHAIGADYRIRGQVPREGPRMLKSAPFIRKLVSEA